MNRLTGLSTRLTLAILLPLSLLLLLSALYESHRDEKTMLGMAETAAANLGESVVEELQGILRSSRTAIDGVALPLEGRRTPTAAEADALLAATVERFPLLFGSALALDRGADLSLPPFARYAYRDAGRVTTSSLEDETYAYWNRPWFTDPLSSNEPYWTDPYLDDGGGGVRMVTYARPLETGGRNAVLTADLRLTFLNDIAESNVLGKAGSVMVFDRRGQLVMHPRQQWILNRSLKDLAEEFQVPALALVPSVINRGESVWLRPEDGMHAGIIADRPDLPGRLFARPLNEAGWGVAVYFSDRDFMTEIIAAKRFKMIFSAATLLFLALLIFLVTRHSLRPVGDLALRTRAIARGDFDADTPGLERTDEIGRLSRAFHLMQEHLQHYVADLTKATAERERLQTELEMAHQIQQMLLPAETPSNPDLSLVAMLRPARAVGGDLYYYRQRPGNSILFAIGDVSDKGIPAALFMARAMAVLEAAATQELTPAEIVNSVNVALTEDNDLCMFVTLLVGELDLNTGRCTLSSAGHEQPIRVSHSAAGAIAIPSGPPVGLDGETEFSETTVVLEPQECLLAYTDGITEARNPRGSMFGDDRLLRTLNSDGGESPAGVLEHTLTDVDQFVDGADQADDITLLAIQWQPKGDSADAPSTGTEKEAPTASGPADAAGAMDYAVKTGCHHHVLTSVRSALEGLQLQAGDPGDLDLVIEETLTNVVKYAGCDGDAMGRVEWVISDSRLSLTFIDPGTPFNPLADKEPEAGLDEFSEGGMGVMLIRHRAESTHYERKQDRNHFTIVLPLSPRLAGE